MTWDNLSSGCWWKSHTWALGDEESPENTYCPTSSRPVLETGWRDQGCNRKDTSEKKQRMKVEVEDKWGCGRGSSSNRNCRRLIFAHWFKRQTSELFCTISLRSMLALRMQRFACGGPGFHSWHHMIKHHEGVNAALRHHEDCHVPKW